MTPANPQSTEQSRTRNTFTWAEDVWKFAGPILTAAWQLYARGQQFVGRNAFVGQNIKAMRGEADLTFLVGSPGARGGLPPTSINTTATSGGIDVTINAPTPPSGWTVAAGQAIAIQDQQPEAPLTDYVYEAEDTNGDPPVVSLAGLTSGTLHQVSAWLKWTKADGTVAYSPSVNATETPAA